MEMMNSCCGNGFLACGRDIIGCGNHLLTCGKNLFICGSYFLTCGNGLFVEKDRLNVLTYSLLNYKMDFQVDRRYLKRRVQGAGPWVYWKIMKVSWKF